MRVLKLKLQWIQLFNPKWWLIALFFLKNTAPHFAGRFDTKLLIL
jgi:hypothetical protein